jgi:hypothetical protein
MAFVERAKMRKACRELVLEHLDSVPGLLRVGLKCINTVV